VTARVKARIKARIKAGFKLALNLVKCIIADFELKIKVKVEKSRFARCPLRIYSAKGGSTILIVDYLLLFDKIWVTQILFFGMLSYG
jgi:hypothetical protein